MKILVYGDGHISEGDNLRRFNASHAVIKRTLPDYIIFIGDALTMDCLSDWDKNKKKIMEGKRFANEINKANQMFDELQAFIKTIPGYNPIIIYLEGNHEYRVERYLEINPTFDGIVNIPIQLRLKQRKIVWVPYRENYNINGISFIHIPINGNGKPIGGEIVLKHALNLYSNSVVFGHIHRLEIAHKKRHNIIQNTALSVGCFFEEEHDYTHGTICNYWKGLVLLDSYKENEFDVQTFSMDRIISDYLAVLPPKKTPVKKSRAKPKEVANVAEIIDKSNEVKNRPFKKTAAVKVEDKPYRKMKRPLEHFPYDLSGDKHNA